MLTTSTTASPGSPVSTPSPGGGSEPWSSSPAHSTAAGTQSRKAGETRVGGRPWRRTSGTTGAGPHPSLAGRAVLPLGVLCGDASAQLKSRGQETRPTEPGHAAALNAKRHGARLGDAPVALRPEPRHVQVVHDVSRSGAGGGMKAGCELPSIAVGGGADAQRAQGQIPALQIREPRLRGAELAPGQRAPLSLPASWRSLADDTSKPEANLASAAGSIRHIRCVTTKMRPGANCPGRIVVFRQT